MSFDFSDFDSRFQRISYLSGMCKSTVSCVTNLEPGDMKHVQTLLKLNLNRINDEHDTVIHFSFVPYF